MTPLDELIADSWFPFAGDVTVKAFEPPVIPEPDRHGVPPADCGSCTRPDSGYVWADERWRLHAFLPTPIPGIVLLETRAHVDSFVDLSPDCLAELGPIVARIERALLSLGDIARVHVNRWGDGGAHFHLWFMPRPLGALQLRGSMLPVWMDVLPDLPDEEAQEPLARLRAALDAG